MDGDHVRPARDRGLSQLRGRSARSAAGHRLRHHRRVHVLQRRGGRVDRAHRHRCQAGRAFRRRGHRDPLGAAGTRDPRNGELHGYVVAHQPVARKCGGSVRQARRRHRHRIHRYPTDPGGGWASQAPHRVSALTRLHAALARPRIRTGRARRAQGELPADPRSAARTPGRGGAAERVLGAARDAGQAAAEDSLGRGADESGRDRRHHGSAELG